MTRKLGNKTTPVVSIDEEGGLYKIKTESWTMWEKTGAITKPKALTESEARIH